VILLSYDQYTPMLHTEQQWLSGKGIWQAQCWILLSSLFWRPLANTGTSNFWARQKVL